MSLFPPALGLWPFRSSAEITADIVRKQREQNSKVVVLHPEQERTMEETTTPETTAVVPVASTANGNGKAGADGGFDGYMGNAQNMRPRPLIAAEVELRGGGRLAKAEHLIGVRTFSPSRWRLVDLTCHRILRWNDYLQDWVVDHDAKLREDEE